MGAKRSSGPGKIAILVERPGGTSGRYVRLRSDARPPRLSLRTGIWGKVRKPTTFPHMRGFAALACGHRPCETRRTGGRDVGSRPTMLVVTRKSNQSIMIGDDIEVSVLSIMGEKVRIGIQAPRDIPVFRKEVYLEIQQENVAAGASARAEVDDALKRLSTQK